MSPLAPGAGKNPVSPCRLTRGTEQRGEVAQGVAERQWHPKEVMEALCRA